MAYSEKIIDHYENPRNVGSLDKAAMNVGTGMVGAPACGDVMKLQIQVDEGDVITDAKFKTFGCGSAIASSSYVTELLIGKKLDDALAIKNDDIAKHLELSAVKIHCSVLAEDAIKHAVEDYRGKQGGAMSEAEAPVAFTPEALARVSDYLKEEGKPYVRFGVKGTGCSGYSYHIETTDNATSDDEVVELNGGGKVLIDAQAMPIVKGTVIGYKEDKFRSGFTYTNPNQKGECGCGESFTV